MSSTWELPACRPPPRAAQRVPGRFHPHFVSDTFLSRKKAGLAQLGGQGSVSTGSSEAADLSLETGGGAAPAPAQRRVLSL